MDIECKKCHRVFQARTENAKYCPDCLDSEYGKAATLKGEERQELKSFSARSCEQQVARAKAFTPVADADLPSRAWAASAIGAFLLCALVIAFFADPLAEFSLSSWQKSDLRILTISCAVLSASLAVPAFKGRRMFVIFTTVIILFFGWILPDFLRTGGDSKPTDKVAAAGDSEEKQAERDTFCDSHQIGKVRDIILNEETENVRDVLYYSLLVKGYQHEVVKLLNQALPRVLRAGTVSYRKLDDDTLFVITCKPEARRDLSSTFSRLGSVVYSDKKNGIYGVKLSHRVASSDNEYGDEALMNDAHPYFVSANRLELLSLDPMRVEAAAMRLAQANLQSSRVDVKNALMETLRDPWEGESSTYTALIDALLDYAEPNDLHAREEFKKYFNHCVTRKADIKPEVIERLASELPDQMAPIVVNMWAGNPVAWAPMLKVLKQYAEKPILDVLAKTTKIELIRGAMSYLAECGTKSSLSVVEVYLSHEDEHTRRMAQNAYDAIRARNAE